VHRLIDVASSMAGAYREGFIARTDSVLWETRREDGAWEGLTDTYIRVRAISDADLANRLTRVRIIGQGEDGLFGEVVL
jgi:hypothetical protein